MVWLQRRDEGNRGYRSAHKFFQLQHVGIPVLNNLLYEFQVEAGSTRLQGMGLLDRYDDSLATTKRATTHDAA